MKQNITTQDEIFLDIIKGRIKFDHFQLFSLVMKSITSLVAI